MCARFSEISLCRGADGRREDRVVDGLVELPRVVRVDVERERDRARGEERRRAEDCCRSSSAKSNSPKGGSRTSRGFGAGGEREQLEREQLVREREQLEREQLVQEREKLVRERGGCAKS